ncbi:hypothetical protein H6P81_005330 [Aristolochia fimbriata]|uniref:Pectinesterase inhibitor domain-containing protein n=1 Tax=Aristolochia fimbriata TaxID=158543 RepID=A0AAV7EX05_ARIFI|nr:hypothetical protein H6P81_005330 [Aristolochia fimbriata]
MEGANAFSQYSSILLPLLFCSIFFSFCTAAEPATDFIKARCTVTRYRRLCIDTLSLYAEKIQQNPRVLAHTALSLTATRARSTSALVSRLLEETRLRRRLTEAEAAAMRDCVENVGDGVDQLRRALREMGHLNGSERGLRISNIQTWVSAALTNYVTCMDGFQEKEIGGELGDRVRGRIDGDMRLTSNALALFNSFAREAP